MKTFTKTSTKLSQLVISALFFFAITMASCSKDTASVAYAYLSVANLSPTLGTYNIYLDGTKSNTSGAIAFGGVSAYTTLTAGSHTLNFTTESSIDALVSKTVSLDENGIYSAFLIDKGADMDVLLVKDEMTVSSTEKAFIRFINLSTDAPALDLSVVDGGTLVSNKAYKASSNFQAIDPKTYSFEIKSNASGIIETVLIDQILTAGKYYTIISKGLINVGDIDQPFGAQLITNL